jgi:UDP-N-acetylmuramoyl-L-alanyl-D-glutamate--2,6-diaminopimelate ligase
LRLHDLLAGFDAIEVRGESDVDISSIEHDHRVVEPGALFCCIRGEHADGHDFAADAVAAGARACLVERWLPVDATQLRVASVRVAIGPLCAEFFGHPSRAMRVLGVTGTNGKTTITYLLEAIARAAGDRVGVIGTVGAHVNGEALPLRHTTPEATELQALFASMRDAGTQTVAIEVSSHALDQHRVDGTELVVACFTNLTHDHLDYHGTLDAYFEAKARLFTPTFTTRTAINVDDPHGEELAGRARAAGLDVITYALDRDDADVTAADVELGPSRTTLTLVHGSVRNAVQSTLVGRFNAANLVGAAATALLAGFDADTIARGLSAPVVVPGRMERVEAGQPFAVLVDYAHTPDALERVLGAARALGDSSARVLVVFGCGGDRDRGKRPAMGEVATRLGDLVIVTSDNPRSENPAQIAADVVAGVDAARAQPEVELDRRRAIRRALGAAAAGDVVVVAGKGHETGQTAGGVTVPFDDRDVVREELEARV